MIIMMNIVVKYQKIKNKYMIKIQKLKYIKRSIYMIYFKIYLSKKKQLLKYQIFLMMNNNKIII